MIVQIAECIHSQVLKDSIIHLIKYYKTCSFKDDKYSLITGTDVEEIELK